MTDFIKEYYWYFAAALALPLGTAGALFGYVTGWVAEGRKQDKSIAGVFVGSVGGVVGLIAAAAWPLGVSILPIVVTIGTASAVMHAVNRRRDT